MIESLTTRLFISPIIVSLLKAVKSSVPLAGVLY